MARTRSEEARTKMLEAAAALALEEGIHGFSIEAVARRSGVAKTTIYRHFAGKNELLIAALDGVMPAPPKPDAGSLREELREYLAGALPIFSDDILRAAFLEIVAASVRDPELGRLQRALVRGRGLTLREIYDRGVASGEISPEIDYADAFEMIEGPFIVRAMIRPRTLAGIDLDALVDRILVSLKGGSR